MKTIGYSTDKCAGRYTPKSNEVYPLDELFTLGEGYHLSAWRSKVADGLDVSKGYPCKEILDNLKEYSIYGANIDAMYFELVDLDDGSTKLCAKFQFIIGGWALCYVSKPKNKRANPLKASLCSLVVSGTNRLQLPDGEISNYPQVKETLLKAGGKYSKGGFNFKTDAQEILERLINGEEINDKKKFQFFATPPALADRLVSLADLSAGMIVLEPSAGQGAIVAAAERTGLDLTIKCLELMPENASVLRSAGYFVSEIDFLTVSELSGLYDRIIANPPFTKNQDIDHIRHMYKFLKSCGRMVSCASLSWRNGSQTKQLAFSEWLREIGAEVIELDGGEFKESGTNIKACIIIINKGA